MPAVTIKPFGEIVKDIKNQFDESCKRTGITPKWSGEIYFEWQADFNAYTALAYIAEPLNALAGNDSKRYLHRGWQYLMSNHSHDANGGCAPDCVCKDMEYRFRKAQDIAEIVADDAMVEIAKNLSPDGQNADVVQLVVYNTLPYERDVIVPLDVEVPDTLGSGITIDGVRIQAIQSEKSSIFMDSIWEVPTILESMHHRLYAENKECSGSWL